MDNNDNSLPSSVEDCFECRLVGGLGCLGICSYIIFQSRQMKGLNQKGMMLIGSSFGLLGLCRLLGVNPFKKVEALK